MRSLLLTAFIGMSLLFMHQMPVAPKRLYELRTYYRAEGKLPDLMARFRTHTMKLFEKHGMTNEVYWLPVDNRENKLVYLMSYPSREVRDQAWKDFQADPEWKKVAADSEKNGKIVLKVEKMFLYTTDFSPRVSHTSGNKSRVFELRTYYASKGNLPHLLNRFDKHTCHLFEKYGMTNLWYWTPTENEPDADRKLLYILAHPSQEEGMQAMKKFGQDATWQQVKKDTEAQTGGSLTDSLASEFLLPTDFSPVK